MRNRTSSIQRQTSIRAFTLVEVLIATILVGLAIAALLAANGSFSMANAAGADLSTAEFLTEQIRELTTMLPVADPATTAWTALGPEGDETTVDAYDDVDDFDGFDSAALGGPIDALHTPLPNLAAFRQQVAVQRLNPSNFDETWADDHNPSSDFVRVTVTILQNGRSIGSASWMRARY